MKPIWTYSLTWFAVVTLALVLAVAAPRESGILGKLPGQVGQSLGKRPVAKAAAAEQRLLVLVSFHRDQRKDVESWIDGLALYQDRKIEWVRMPVVHDPGDDGSRMAVQSKLLARYVTPQERENLIPVFIDRDTFLRSTGLRDVDSVYVLVINRSGDVLARVPGPYDETKGQAVRETLEDQDL